MDYKNLKLQIKESIGILTISRPKEMNALNSDTIKEIKEVLKKIKYEKIIKILIITGEGEKAFCAGADINEVKNIGLKDAFEFLRAGQEMNNEIENLGIPTIAAVNGIALGGGCELALACSLRVVAENAKFGLPEVGLGVIPGYGGTQRLVRLIGKGRALYYLLTGDMIDADTAFKLGLANVVIKKEELIDTALKIARKIISKSPLAIKMLLNAVRYGSETDIETALVIEAAFGNITLASKDKEEGIKAFFEKRRPEFKGE